MRLISKMERTLLVVGLVCIITESLATSTEHPTSVSDNELIQENPAAIEGTSSELDTRNVSPEQETRSLLRSRYGRHGNGNFYQPQSAFGGSYSRPPGRIRRFFDRNSRYGAPFGYGPQSLNGYGGLPPAYGGNRLGLSPYKQNGGGYPGGRGRFFPQQYGPGAGFYNDVPLVQPVFG